MSIDKAIAHAREKAKEQRSHIGTWDEEYSKRCEEYAEELEQLAEWLEELKNNRIALEKANGYLEANYNLGYNKAIDDFIKEIKEEIKVDKNGFNSYYGTQCIDVLEVLKIAERLKARLKDE